MSLKSLLTRRDTFVLESAPLHTEDPKHSAQAPAQIEAACKRGAHVIVLTETRGQDMAAAKKVAAEYGYVWFQAAMDAHRNVSVLVKSRFKVLHVEDVVVFNNHRVGVTFDFHGSPVTVYAMHWEPSAKGHEVQTAALVEVMAETSRGTGKSFYAGDSNPDLPQHKLGSEPDTALAAAKMPVIYDELGDFPSGIGVNVIGRNLADAGVEAVSVTTHEALGSDHIPVTATYSIKRPKIRSKR